MNKHLLPHKQFHLPLGIPVLDTSSSNATLNTTITFCSRQFNQKVENLPEGDGKWKEDQQGGEAGRREMTKENMATSTILTTWKFRFTGKTRFYILSQYDLQTAS